MIDSNNVDAYINKGNSLSFLNKDEEAQENYNTALEIDKIYAQKLICYDKFYEVNQSFSNIFEFKD